MELKLDYPELASLIEQIKTNNNIYLIGVAGIPGAGKSTLSAEYLQKIIPNSTVLPMDGYHLYRKDLDENGHRFRGAAFTFDSKKFKHDLEELKKNRCGSFPSFDHAKKDPLEDDIKIDKDVKCVIVEGLYLFLEEWGLQKLFDAKIFITCDVDLAMKRVAERHLKCGIVDNIEDGFKRANDNDRKNAEYIIKDSVIDESVIVIKSDK